jgi:F-type H+-transporting ATPase subunit epsilon
MQIEIITPDKTLFNGDADSVTLPGSSGAFQLLNNHAPIVSSLVAGKVVVKNGNQTNEIEISGGIVEVLRNKVIVLA